MMIYTKKFLYSATTNSFYPTAMLSAYENANSLPDDVVEIDDSEAEEFMSETPVDKVRCGGENGHPTWCNVPPLTVEQQILIAEKIRQALLDEAATLTCDWRTELMLGTIDDSDKSKLAKWMGYIKKLRAVDTKKVPDIKWPSRPEN